jgi:hypothetical protein
MRYPTGRSRERARRRNALILGVTKWVLLLAIFAAIGYSSYESGLWLAERKLIGLREELARTVGSLAETERARDDLQARLAEANDEIGALQRRYDADVPTGAPAELLKLARERLADGLAADRLAEALRAAQAVIPCEGRPVTRRFRYRADVQPVPEDTAGFADGLISLQATLAPGEDPSRPTTVVFTRANAPPITATGRLPLHQSIVLDNVEYRFTVAASDLRGYLTATANSCAR